MYFRKLRLKVPFWKVLVEGGALQPLWTGDPTTQHLCVRFVWQRESIFFTCPKILQSQGCQWRTSTVKFILVVSRQITASQQQNCFALHASNFGFWHHFQVVYLMQKLVQLEVPLFLLVNGSQFLQNEQWYLIVFAVFDLRKDDDLQSIHFWLSDQRKEQLHKIEFVIIICRGWTVSYLFGFPMNTWSVNLHNSEDSSTTGAITDKMETASNFSYNVKMCRPSELEKWENPVKLKKAIISVVALDCPCNGHANKTLFADCQKSRWLRQLQKFVWSI